MPKAHRDKTATPYLTDPQVEHLAVTMAEVTDDGALALLVWFAAQTGM